MPSHSQERMQRLSMVYALWGLFFASLAAGLIVLRGQTMFHTVVVVDTQSPQVLELKRVNFIRGSRRLNIMEAPNKVRQPIVHQ